MTLFQITTGYTGESYVRSYVWAESHEKAFALFEAMCDADPKLEKYLKRVSKMDVEELFDASDPPFCTKPSDSGWET